MSENILAADVKFTPYWWDEVPPEPSTDAAPPRQADVVVIGAGFTGLSAALVLARGGRDVVVLDAEAPGHGCSTRNGGQVGPGIRIQHEDLMARYGREKGMAVFMEGQEAFKFLTSFIEQEGIDCKFERCGHFLGAHSPGKFEYLKRRAQSESSEIGLEALIVPRSEQRREVGTDAFHGGILYPNNGALDPGFYHKGLLRKVTEAGGRVFGHQPALGLKHDAGRHIVATPSGTIAARDVVIATNGYTGPALPWWRRRVIPIGSYIIATEPLPPDLMKKICPKGRMMQETTKVVYYYRPSPDGTRILFGGRVALQETDGRVSAPRLHAAMTRIFPELRSVKVTHSWFGFVAFTFDHLPHIGSRDGVHHAMGYCGNGVPLSTYLGHKVGYGILGKPEGKTPLRDLTFQTRPFYTGKPWFLAPSLAYYKLRDRLAR